VPNRTKIPHFKVFWEVWGKKNLKKRYFIKEVIY